MLFCGCGIGSYLAEVVLRMGCLDLTLVDMDTVSETNLNRQNYEVSDVGMPKVFGLAKHHKKHLLSAMSVGFGAGFFYFSTAHEYSFRDHIEAKTGRPISEMNYAEAFQVVLASLLPVLNEEVKVVLEGVIEQMAKKQPCPASQVSVGGMCCAALTATALEHIARGEALTPFPQFYYLDLHQLIRQKQGTVIF